MLPLLLIALEICFLVASTDPPIAQDEGSLFSALLSPRVPLNLFLLFWVRLIQSYEQMSVIPFTRYVITIDEFQVVCMPVGVGAFAISAFWVANNTRMHRENHRAPHIHKAFIIFLYVVYNFAVRRDANEWIPAISYVLMSFALPHIYIPSILEILGNAPAARTAYLAIIAGTFFMADFSLRLYAVWTWRLNFWKAKFEIPGNRSDLYIDLFMN